MTEPSSTTAPKNQPFMLGEATVEPLRNLISRDGQHFQVERQVMLVLLFLVEHADQVVTRESLLFNLWENSVPKDEALTQAVSKLRKALGDSSKKSRVIQTIRKVGYRLVGPVSYVPDPNPTQVPERPPIKQATRKWALVTGIAILFLGIVFLFNTVTIRTTISRDASPTHKVRLIILRNHQKIPATMIQPGDQGDAKPIEQEKPTPRP